MYASFYVAHASGLRVCGVQSVAHYELVLNTLKLNALRFCRGFFEHTEKVNRPKKPHIHIAIKTNLIKKKRHHRNFK